MRAAGALPCGLPHPPAFCRSRVRCVERRVVQLMSNSPKKLIPRSGPDMLTAGGDTPTHQLSREDCSMSSRTPIATADPPSHWREAHYQRNLWLLAVGQGLSRLGDGLYMAA